MKVQNVLQTPCTAENPLFELGDEWRKMSLGWDAAVSTLCQLPNYRPTFKKTHDLITTMRKCDYHGYQNRIRNLYLGSLL